MIHFSDVRFASPLFRFAAYVRGFIVDRPDIKIVGVDPVGNIGSSLYLHTSDGQTGILAFSLVMESEKAVKIESVSIDYSGPLQLSDPEQRGFFVGTGSNDKTFPIRLTWSAGTESGPKQVHAFAVSANLPEAVSKIPLRVTVLAKVVHEKFGGYLDHGKLHKTTATLQVLRADSPVPLFCAPSGYGFTSPQPFIIQNGMTIISADPSRIEVHQWNSDGSSSSRSAAE